MTGRLQPKTAILAIICISYFMVILDNSIIFTGLPRIEAAMGFSPTGLTWVQGSYTLVFGGLLLLGARAGDIVGRRRMFVAGLVLFGAASFDYGAVPALLDALAGRSVRVVLMTSIGVTASGGSSRELLDWKHRGERLLRASGLPYTVVRPGWFDAGSVSEQRIDLRQGDRTEYGPVRREHVAEVLVQALRTPSAVGRTVEVFSTDGSPIRDWEAAFTAATPDQPGSLDGAQDRPGVPPNREPARFQNDLHRLGAATTAQENQP